MDITQSTLLAQLAADREYKQGTKEPQKWFKEYMKILENLGWEFSRHE